MEFLVVAKNLQQSLQDFVTMIIEGSLEKYVLGDHNVNDLVEKAFATFIDDSKNVKSVEHKEDIVKLMSDIMFNNSTQHLAEVSAKNGHDVYLYTFDYHRPSVGGLIGHLFPFKGKKFT